MENLIFRLVQLGYDPQLTPKQNRIELILKDSDGKVVTTQYGETDYDCFAKAMVKLGTDSLNYRKSLVDKSGLSVL